MLTLWAIVILTLWAIVIINTLMLQIGLKLSYILAEFLGDFGLDLVEFLSCFLIVFLSKVCCFSLRLVRF